MLDKDHPSQEDHYLNTDITLTEMTKAQKSLNSNTSAVGIDGLSYQLLLHLPSKWKALLLTLFQQVWKNGALPNVWKQSVIVPILKQGKNRKNVESYRPIALTSQCRKLFEKIILNRLLLR